MARHDARGRTHSERAEEGAQAPTVAMPGGAPGSLSPGSSVAPMRVAMPEPRERTPISFMVMSGPRDDSGKIRFNDPTSGIVLLLPGKIITDASHPIDLMRRQGIRLEVVPDAVGEGGDQPAEAEAEQPAAG